MLTGQNGILLQAQKAKTETENAAQNEAAILDDYESTINKTLGIPVPPEKDEEGFFKENSTINGEQGSAMNPTIPEGFRPKDENGAVWGDGTNPPTTDSVNNGLVIEDRNGNEFVWIPVTGNYERNTSYGYANVSSTAYTDTGYLPDGMETGDSTSNENAERSAVTSKGGFYISRYEAGKEGTSTLVSKSGATVWVSIPQADCKTTAKAFINNNNVKSALCSGIQWDMTMVFVNGKEDGSSDADKTYNVTQYKASRHTGSKTTSGQNQVDRVCNIFDLEGNYWEYVAEMSPSDKNTPFVARGGRYDDTYPASIRISSDGAAHQRFFPFCTVRQVKFCKRSMREQNFIT